MSAEARKKICVECLTQSDVLNRMQKRRMRKRILKKATFWNFNCPVEIKNNGCKYKLEHIVFG